MRVLVIDDNADCAFILRELICKCGHEAELAVTAEAGLSKARQLQPEVIFLDLALTGADGYKLAPRLRAQISQPVKIVAVSGSNDDPPRRMAAGIDLHFVKPASLEQLTESLNVAPLNAAS